MTEPEVMDAKKAFAEGIGDLIDVVGVTCDYNDSHTPPIEDFKAIEGDWRIIGEILSSIMGMYSIGEKREKTRRKERETF